MHVLAWCDFAETGCPEKTAMTIGVFDGIHRGHQILIQKIVQQGLRSTVVTFRQSPKEVLHPETAGGAILSLSQKLRIFEGLGVFQTILIDFSENFSKLKGQEFMDLLITRGKMAALVIGSNFRCGYQLDTDAELIKERNEIQGIKTEVVPRVFEGTDPISSSRIRKAIAKGDLVAARAALGRNVSIDLQGISAKPAGDGWRFDVASQSRVIPPAGWYSAVVYEMNRDILAGKKTEIRITQGSIVVLSSFNADAVSSIELVCGSQGA